ncbi:mucin-2-like [Physella acuta]|uniref:mucin-2-like n=1 Tax=Physella acuta TaxID=109671 RepID=UPI0027DD6845|nr:mucin-2-like [Physella acuta]
MSKVEVKELKMFFLFLIWIVWTAELVQGQNHLGLEKQAVGCHHCDGHGHHFPTCLTTHVTCAAGEVCSIVYGEGEPSLTCKREQDCAHEILHSIGTCPGGGVLSHTNRCQVCCDTTQCVNDVTHLLLEAFETGLYCPGECSKLDILTCVLKATHCLADQFCQVSLDNRMVVKGECRNNHEFQHCIHTKAQHPCDHPVTHGHQNSACVWDCCTTNECLYLHFGEHFEQVMSPTRSTQFSTSSTTSTTTPSTTTSTPSTTTSTASTTTSTPSTTTSTPSTTTSTPSTTTSTPSTTTSTTSTTTSTPSTTTSTSTPSTTTSTPSTTTPSTTTSTPSTTTSTPSTTTTTPSTTTPSTTTSTPSTTTSTPSTTTSTPSTTTSTPSTTTSTPSTTTTTPSTTTSTSSTTTSTPSTTTSTPSTTTTTPSTTTSTSSTTTSTPSTTTTTTTPSTTTSTPSTTTSTPTTPSTTTSTPSTTTSTPSTTTSTPSTTTSTLSTTTSTPSTTTSTPSTTTSTPLTTTPSTPTSTTSTPTTSSSTSATSTTGLLDHLLICFTCSGLSCLLQPTQSFCHDGYCMTSLYESADGSRQISKLCATEQQCRDLWWGQTFHNKHCMDVVQSGAGPNGQDTTCHYCCNRSFCNDYINNLTLIHFD